jgi:hypothetical protein
MTIDAAALVSSNVAETVALYDAGRTYAEGDEARSDTDAGAVIYRSIVGANTGNPLADADAWLQIGPTNRWLMFDTYVTTQTANDESIDIEIQAMGRIDSAAALNLDAASIQIIAEDETDGIVFDETYSLVSDSGISDLYAWLTEPIERVADFFTNDIPPMYAGLMVTVNLLNTGAEAKCGALVLGLSKELGDTETGATVGITDYSRKEQNDFGDYTIVERAFAKRANFTVWMERGATDQAQILLARYRATPIVYVGEEEFGSTVILGFYRSFDIELAYPTHSICSIEIEGLT